MADPGHPALNLPMNITALTTGPFEEICYIAWNEEQQCIVFDPGHDANQILRQLDALHLDVAAYVCTHGHADHISALGDLHDVRPAPVAMHALDLEWAFSEAAHIEPFYPVPRRPAVETFLFLESAGAWCFAGLSFQCLETPGHTPGSCCLYFQHDAILIAGDTLFRGSCGRTDLPGGSPRAMKESLTSLRKLPDDVRVYPGHGPDTTIGIECASNYFMQPAG